METINKKLRRFIATAFFACLALPGIASATYILDLSDNNPIFTADFASGTVFSDPAGLGWDLKVTGLAGGSSSGQIVRTNSEGMGVDDPNSTINNALDPGDQLVFEFNPDAMLEGFILELANNDSYFFSVIGNPVVGNFVLNGGASGVTIDAVSIAGGLTVGSAGGAFRVGSLLFADPVAAAAVAEPAVLGLLGFGLLGMAGMRRMRKSA